MNFSVKRIKNYTTKIETMYTNLEWQEAYNIVKAMNSGWNYRYWITY